MKLHLLDGRYYRQNSCDTKSLTAVPATTFGKLHEFWSSSILDQDTKIRLYKCGVWSKLTAKMYVSVPKGLERGIRHRTPPPKPSRAPFAWVVMFAPTRWIGCITESLSHNRKAANLTDHLRTRLKWGGLILAQGRELPARMMLMRQKESFEEGSVLMDAPEHDTMPQHTVGARRARTERWRRVVATRHECYCT